MEEVSGGENIVEQLTQNKEFAKLLEGFDHFLPDFTVEKMGPKNTWFAKATRQLTYWDKHQPLKEKIQKLNEKARQILGKGNDWNFLTPENFPLLVDAVNKAKEILTAGTPVSTGTPKKPAAAKPATPVASSTTESSVGMADDLAPLTKDTPPPAAQPALLVTPKAAVNFQALLTAEAVEEINENLPKGYTLKSSGSGSYHLDGPIKILIRADGQMVSFDENKNHKDAEQIMNAMHAICVINFYLGLEPDNFNWHEQIPDDKKEAFNKKKEDLRKTFSKKIDAGNVYISSGPTAETRKSNYDIQYFLKKPGVAEAIQKAVGTKDYVYNPDKNTIMRTFTNGQTRTLTIEKDGTISGPPIPLEKVKIGGEERFKSPLPDDDRVESQLEARLYNDFVVIARALVTLYHKTGAEALPETLDFRSQIKGTTWQKQQLEKITDHVFQKLVEQEFKSKPFMGKKGYYPQEFLDRVLFNGKKANLQAVDSPKRAIQDTPDEEPPAKRQNLSMGKST